MAADPLAHEAAWRAGVRDRSVLLDANEARTRCNELVDDINELALQWEAMRLGTLDRDTLAVVVDDAERQWRAHRAACEGAITRLPAGAITESVLTWQRQQMDSIWSPLVAMCRAHLAEQGPEAVQRQADRFAVELAEYATWLERAVVFWEGAYLTEAPAPACLQDARDAARGLGRDVRTLMVMAPAQRDPAAIERLRGVRTGLAKSLPQCAAGGGLDDLQLVELGLLDELLGSCTMAIDGLANGDPRRLDQAMDEEQRITERLERCRLEYGAPAAEVSEACRPRTLESR